MFEKYFTTDDVAAMIHDAYQGGGDLTAIYKAVDALRGKTEEVQKTDDLKAAVEAAKTSTDRPRAFAVAYRNPRGSVRVAHGVEYANGGIDVESGHGTIGGYDDTLAELHETAKKNHGDAYHFDYIDEP